MKREPKKKLPNKKVISSAKFEAKEQFTKSASVSGGQGVSDQQ
jgi:hypothetical protein